MTRTTQLAVIALAIGLLAAAITLTQTARGKAFIARKPWIRNGERTELYPNGNLKLTQHRRAGKSHGLCTFWYPNGKKQLELSFSRGEREGKCEGWHENGQPAYTGQFTGNKYDGAWQFFSTHGTRIAEVTCKNGLFWDGDDARYEGDILIISTYKDGQIISVEKRSE